MANSNIKMRNYPKNFKFFDSLLIFLGGLSLFTVGLSGQEIIGFDSRFYLFAQEMLRHGVSLFPTTYHHPYPDYPATSTLLIYFLAKLTGTLNKCVAVFPSAMAASLTLVLTYLLGAWHERRWGLGAVFFLLLTITFVTSARSISLDLYITLITAATFYVLYSASELKTTRRLYGILPWLFLAGFLFRGPIGLVIPAGVASMYYLIERDLKHFFAVGLLAVLSLAFCMIIWAWMAYHTGGTSLLQAVLGQEMVSRIASASTPPFYFYWIESLGAYAVTFPLTILMIPLIMQCNQPKEKKLLGQLLGWVLIVLIGLSVPGDKKVRYILSIAPALALISAYLFVGREKSFYWKLLNRLNEWICLLLPFTCLLAVYFFHDKLILTAFSTRMIFSIFILLQVSSVIFYFLKKEYRLGILFCAAMTFMTVIIGISEPLLLRLNSTRDFVLSVEKYRHHQHAPLIFYRNGADTVAIKYQIYMPIETELQFANSLAELMAVSEFAVVITSEEYYAALPEVIKAQYPIVLQGKIGTDKMIIFNKTASHPRVSS